MNNLKIDRPLALWQVNKRFLMKWSVKGEDCLSEASSAA